MYVFNLFDMQSGGISLLFIGFCEAAVIGWGVGKDIIVNLSSFHFPFLSFITRQFEDPLKLFPRCSHCLGTQTLGDMIEKMIGKRPNIFFLICWKYLSPLATLVRVESNVVDISLLCSSFYSAKSVHEMKYSIKGSCQQSYSSISNARLNEKYDDINMCLVARHQSSKDRLDIQMRNYFIDIFIFYEE